MITLNTILYEGNFVKYLTDDCWFFTFKSKYITKKLLTINNLTSIELFNELINKLKVKHDFDVVFVSDYDTEAIKKFNLNMDANSIGYWYSIPYFVDILTITTPFIFNVSSDCCDEIKVNDDYFEKSINILNGDNDYPVTTLPWGEHWGTVGVPNGIPSHVSCVGEWEQLNLPEYTIEKALDDFWCSGVFSDQVFIGHIDKLKAIDYNCPKMGRYNGPPYGGSNAFEARLSEYLAKNNLFRLIFKNKELYYKHIG
jgi:hypothetical protein